MGALTIEAFCEISSAIRSWRALVVAFLGSSGAIFDVEGVTSVSDPEMDVLFDELRRGRAFVEGGATIISMAGCVSF
jgi:hypothetical protein